MTTEPTNKRDNEPALSAGSELGAAPGYANRVNAYEVLGWAHAYYCSALDRGEDPRQTEVPKIKEAFERDFSSHTATEMSHRQKNP